MHDIPVLRELLLIASASLAVVLVFQRLKLPPTIGFIVTGILIGPGGFGLVRDAVFVRTMAEIGVVLLLFTVGLEFSLTDLRRLGRTAIIGGGFQVFLTLGLVALGFVAFGMHPAPAIFLGMLAALSSTAVVLKLLTDRFELESPHGRLATAVLIFQDLIAVLFLLAVPLLGRWYGGTDPAAHGAPSLWAAVIVVGLFVLLFLGGQRALRWVFARAARSRSREAFLFGVVLVALGSASLAAWAGLSLALGAFLAGLLLAESDFREQVAADVLPFRDTLASVFFVSLGMSFLPASVIEHPGIVFGSAFLLVVIKLGAGVLALRLAGANWRVGFAAALVLAQIGEFSFMIAQAGQPYGLFSGTIGQAFFASAVFSLMLTPLLVARAPDWALQLEMRVTALRLRGGRSVADLPSSALADAPRSNLLAGHVVIAGFGLNGRNLARVLRSVRVPHVIVDLNADALATEAAAGSTTLVGDITRELILKQAGVTRARVLVLAISDPTATRQACRVARALSADVHIIVRTRQVAEIDGLFTVGANQVIPEEFETSIEIFTAVLRDYHVPGNVIDAQIRLLRQERYSLLRGRRLPGSVVEQLEAIMLEGTTDTFLLLQHSPAVGKTVGELSLGQGGDCALVAVVRGGRALKAYDETLELRVGDTLVMTGNHASMDRLFQKLQPREGESPGADSAPPAV